MTLISITAGWVLADVSRFLLSVGGSSCQLPQGLSTPVGLAFQYTHFACAFCCSGKAGMWDGGVVFPTASPTVS